MSRQKYLYYSKDLITRGMKVPKVYFSPVKNNVNSIREHISSFKSLYDKETFINSKLIPMTQQEFNNFKKTDVFKNMFKSPQYKKAIHRVKYPFVDKFTLMNTNLYRLINILKNFNQDDYIDTNYTRIINSYNQTYNTNFNIHDLEHDLFISRLGLGNMTQRILNGIEHDVKFNSIAYNYDNCMQALNNLRNNYDKNKSYIVYYDYNSVYLKRATFNKVILYILQPLLNIHEELLNN